MSNGFVHNSPLGINLDISNNNPEISKYSRFIKNLTTAVNVNTDTGVPQLAGNNETTFTPLLSNIPVCDSLVLPNGDNYCCGSFNDTNSKETYLFVWNSLNNHFIYRINENYSCEMVYQGSCLNFQLHPENYIPQNRSELFYKCQVNLFTGLDGYIRDLIWVDGFNWQNFLSVNDSIATQSFTRDSSGPTDKFKYSNPLDAANSVVFDQCEYIQLIPRPPLGCIGITEIENNERTKNNFLLNKIWQFRVKFFDVWNRESEHGVISNLYVPTTNGCQTNAEGLPRCLKLNIEAGSPIVSKIVIEFRNCIDTNSDIPATTDWYIYDTVDKYASCGANDGKDWFDRIITLTDYDPVTNTWDYTFCADKQCTPIPVEQTNRTQNDLPITSSALVRLGNGIGLANNVVGYPAIPCEVIESFNVEYEAPTVTCKTKFCDIEFWAVIHNAFVDVNEFVYNVGGTKPNPAGGFVGGAWSWGGIGQWQGATGGVPEVSTAGTDYLQTFKGQGDGQENFFAYLEGTDFKVQGFQQLFEGGALQEWGGQQLNDSATKRQVARRIANGGYYLQHFVFRNVPLGKYLIRIAGHNNAMDSNYQNSSTYVVGTIDRANYTSNNINWGALDVYYKELEINTCDFGGSVYSISTMPMILDLTCPDPTFLTNNIRSNVYFGYLKDLLGFPVELSPVVIKNVGSDPDIDLSIASDGALTNPIPGLLNKTDHNGFWFCAFGLDGVVVINNSINFVYFVEDNTCNSPGIGFSDHVNTINADASEIPLIVSESAVPGYSKCQTVTIQGQITDCNNHPVSGIVVCYTRSKSSKTNNLGYFDIVLHNDIDTNLPTPTVLGRQLGAGADDDRIFISQNGLCAFFSCNTCEMCVDVDYNVDINDDLDCFECVACGEDMCHKIINVITTKIRFPFSNTHGLRHGSINKFGLKYYDAAGRHTFVGTDEHLVLTIPKEQQQLNQLFGKVKYTIAQRTFPDWVKYIGIYWTDQNAYIKYLNFVVSSVDINSPAPGKITLGFVSIINYNTDNNFKTNTTWEFLKGDRIEFIADENGNYFNANDPAIGILNFQIEGNIANTSGIIDYDSRLANLKIGTLIQLQRPKECNTELFYYEICSPIKLDESNRIPTTKLTGYLDVWNAYYVSRKIRYPFGGIDNAIHLYPFQFEHFSPSDLFGGACGNRGRVNTVNPYAQQYCKPMSIMESDQYSTNINGLSHFDNKNEYIFDDSNNGGITAIIPRLNYLLVICSKAAFVSVWDENTLQINSQGNVIYNANRFGRPQPFARLFGCEVVDISTISTYDGKVVYLDRNNGGLIINNYQEARDISEDKFHGYFISKLDVVSKNNNNPQKTVEKIFVAAINTESNEYTLTQFDLPIHFDPLDPKPNYINSDADVNLQAPETFAIRLDNLSMRSFYSFCPEGYNIHNDKLVSFKQGKAYNHGIRPTSSFNEFYGVKNIAVYDFVSNCDSPDLTKFYQWHEIHRSNKNWYATQISTQQGQLSEVPLNFYEIVEDFETSQFLCDILTFADPSNPMLATAGGRLVEGDTLKGQWIRVKLISDTANSDEYFELSNCVVFCSGVQKSGDDGLPK